MPRDRNADSNRGRGPRRTPADTRARDQRSCHRRPLQSAGAQDYGSEGWMMAAPSNAPTRDQAGIAVLRAIRAALAAGLTEVEIRALVNRALTTDQKAEE